MKKTTPPKRFKAVSLAVQKTHVVLVEVEKRISTKTPYYRHLISRFFGRCESNMYETFTPDSLKNAVFLLMSPFKSKFGGFDFFLGERSPRWLVKEGQKQIKIPWVRFFTFKRITKK